MAYVVRMPKLGVEMETGTVVEWHVDVDGPVEEGEVVAEIESEKTTAEVTAREDGVLRRVYMAEGDEGPPGAPMGIVAGADEDVADLEADLDVPAGADAGRDAEGDATATAEHEPADVDGDGAADPTDETATGGAAADRTGAAERDPADRTATAGAEGATEAAGAGEVGGVDGAGGGDGTAEGVAPRTPEGRIKATPKARRLARERDVALATVAGTGPGGSIVASDVEAADAGGAAPRTVREERPLSSMRSAIAGRLGRSHREAPHVTVDREIDVEAALAAAERADAAADVDVSIADVFLAAASATLEEHPAFNATFDAEREVHTLYEEHNVGVAVDVEGGLVTPVLPDVRGAAPREVARARRPLVDRVRDGEYVADDLSGGTFTVSNLGAFGSDSFTPIINPPEVAILGINRVRERAVNADDGIAFRRHVTVSLSFDHRVVDGADAARFLATLDRHLADAGALVADP